MVSRLFTRFGFPTSRAVPLFDIRLSKDYVVFNDAENQQQNNDLQGSVVFCVSKPFDAKSIRLTLIGTKSIGWRELREGILGDKKVCGRETIYQRYWTIKGEESRGKERIEIGNYEFPFIASLDSCMTESIQGLNDTYIHYELIAVIDRTYAADLVVKKSVFLFHRPDENFLSEQIPLVLQNVWDDKVTYIIETDRCCFPGGSPLNIYFQVVPLVKGIRPRTLISKVVERHDLSLESSVVDAVENSSSSTRVICKDEIEIDNLAPTECLGNGAEGFEIVQTVRLPTEPSLYTQSFVTKGIRVKHTLNIVVHLLNADGHISEIRANLPISIFRPPMLEPNLGMELPLQLQDEFLSSNILLDPLPSYNASQHDILLPAAQAASRARADGGLSRESNFTQSSLDTVRGHPVPRVIMSDMNRVPPYQSTTRPNAIPSNYTMSPDYVLTAHNSIVRSLS